MHLLRSLASHYCRNHHHHHHHLPRPSSSSSYLSASHVHGRTPSCIHGIRAFNGRRWYSVNSASERDPLQHNGAKTNTGRWALGCMLTLIFPFFTNKWNTLSKLQGEMEIAAELVETAAEVAEKVSSEVAERLPEDGKLKEAALLVERASKAAAKQAHLASEIIDEVDKLKEEVEKLIEPIVGPENNVRTSK